jgi:hypothetical protein
MKAFFGVAACLLLAAGAAWADWSENFDSYTAGSGLIGQGGWQGWDENPAWDALVSNEQANSSPNSVKIIQTSDVVQAFTDYTSGTWSFSGYNYVPSGSTGVQYFILLSFYEPNGSNNEWCLDLKFDSNTGTVSAVEGGGSTSLVFDQWVKTEILINLDSNTQTIFYNDTELGTIAWSENATQNLAALDLFGNNATPIYWDDLVLEPSFSLSQTTWGQIKASW